MLKVSLKEISRKYGRSVVFRNINLTVEAGSETAITGENGAGKSTLLKIIAGFTSPHSGEISWLDGDIAVSREKLPMLISFCSPALQLPPSLTVKETLQLHFLLRRPLLPQAEIEEKLKLPAHKTLNMLSTGMLQRLKLGLALFTESKLVLLDEPTANLDNVWKLHYQDWVETGRGKRTLIIASNDDQEFAFCRETYRISGG